LVSVAVEDARAADEEVAWVHRELSLHGPVHHRQDLRATGDDALGEHQGALGHARDVEGFHAIHIREQLGGVLLDRALAGRQHTRSDRVVIVVLRPAHGAGERLAIGVAGAPPRAAAALEAEHLNGLVHHLRRHHAVGRELSASDGDEAVAADDHAVLATDGGLVDLAARVGLRSDERAQAAPGGDDVVKRDRGAWEVAVGGVDEVGHVLEGGVNLRGIALEVGVGGADVGRVLPGDREEHAPVRRVKTDHGVLHRQPFVRDDDVNALGGTQDAAGLNARERHGAIGPGAGGVDDDRGAHLAELVRELILDDRAADSPGALVVDEGDDAGVGGDGGASDRGVERGLYGEARVVGGAVVVERRAGEALLPQQRLNLGDRWRLERLVELGRPEEREPVVHPHAGVDDPELLARLFVHGEQEAERVHQVGRDVEQDAALAHGLEDQAELVVFEVAQAAVDQLGRARAGAEREVAHLNQRDGQAAARRIAGDASAGDAAADDKQIYGRGEPRAHLSARSHLPS